MHHMIERANISEIPALEQYREKLLSLNKDFKDATTLWGEDEEKLNEKLKDIFGFYSDDPDEMHQRITETIMTEDIKRKNEESTEKREDQEKFTLEELQKRAEKDYEDYIARTEESAKKQNLTKEAEAAKRAREARQNNDERDNISANSTYHKSGNTFDGEEKTKSFGSTSYRTVTPTSTSNVNFGFDSTSKTNSTSTSNFNTTNTTTNTSNTTRPGESLLTERDMQFRKQMEKVYKAAIISAVQRVDGWKGNKEKEEKEVERLNRNESNVLKKTINKFKVFLKTKRARLTMKVVAIMTLNLMSAILTKQVTFDNVGQIIALLSIGGSMFYLSRELAEEGIDVGKIM